MATITTRRAFLKAAAALSATALAACQPKVVEVTRVVEKEVEKVVKETVVIEGTPQVVEKVVKETVVVQVKPTVAEKVTIRFHEGIRPADTGRAEQIFAQFAEENPGIEIKNEPLPENWPDKTLAMMAAGTAPDVQRGYGDPMYAFVSRNMFTDLQPAIERDLTQADIDDFVKPQFDFFSFGKPGKKFAMPMYCGTSAFLYNKGMFDEFGIAYPDNEWDWTTGLEIG
ncbi:MAG: extracellular solute-binding protein, partial [Anaerolineae bacterium]|nr:extracellular solute-binding protein [Anaerolineae bacterium]